MFVSLVTGTRPQIVKTAPVMSALEETGIDFEFIHTGQHYDFEMAGVFIKEFGLEAPYNLEVGSGQIIEQMSMIMKGLSDHYKKKRPDYMIVPGDTTSALGAGLAGFKLEIPVFHLESGLRRYDMAFQEEVNRRLLDHGSSGLFAPTDTAVKNLKEERVVGHIYQIGDTMYDILKEHLPKYQNSDYADKILSQANVEKDDYAVVTVHRRESVDFVDSLTNVVDALNSLDFQVVFPIHPRTKARMSEFDLSLQNHVKVIEPQGYVEFMCFLANSKLTISDSGGVQKECYLLNVPLVNLQTRTEWIETFDAGANLLTPLESKAIIDACQKMYGKRLNNDPSVYGDGSASKRIPPIIDSGEVTLPRDRSWNPYAAHFGFST